MKKIIILTILALMNLGVNGQGDNIGGDDIPGLPNIIPPSPTAYELGKYGQIPVGLFTGTPNVSVPLYTYRTKNLTLPISLSYNSNGLKVDQVSSNVGLGWSLNIGGVITRIVRDIDDDEGNWFFPEEDITGPFLMNPMAMEYFSRASESYHDSEPDLYMYNFNGYSGKFVFDNDKKIILMPHDDIKIETIFEDNQGGFKITTPDGSQYSFLVSETTHPLVIGGGHQDPTFVKGSWYLTSIQHPSGDKINLVYEGNSYSYTVGYSESVNIPAFTQLVCGNVYNPGSSYPITSIEHYSTIYGKKISHLSSNNPNDGIMYLSYDVNHPSISGLKMVSEISIEDKTSSEIEVFTFDYETTTNDRIF